MAATLPPALILPVFTPDGTVPEFSPSALTEPKKDLILNFTLPPNFTSSTITRIAQITNPTMEAVVLFIGWLA